MAEETEVERLVVRLTGDNSGYQKMIEDSIQESINLEKQLASSLSSTQQSLQQAAREKFATTARLLGGGDAATEEGLRMGMEQEYQKILQEGEAITRSVRTEQEIYSDRVQELTKYLELGAIGQETYNRAVGEAEQRLANSQKATDEYLAAIKQVGITTTVTGAAITTAFGGVYYASLRAYSEAETASVKLDAAIKTNGGNVEQLRQQYNLFSRNLQETTTTSNTAAIEMLQYAEALGVSGNQAQRAVKNALALSAAIGISEHAALRMTTALEQGHTTMLGRYIPALKGIKDESERAEKAQEALTKMYGAVEAQANTTTGTTLRLRNAIDDIREDLGERFSSKVKSLNVLLTDWANNYKSLSEESKDLAAITVQTGIGIGSVITTIGGGVTSFGSFLEQAKRVRAVMGGISLASIAAKTGMAAAVAGIVAGGFYLSAQIRDWIDDLNGFNAQAEELQNKSRGTIGNINAISAKAQTDIASTSDPAKQDQILQQARSSLIAEQQKLATEAKRVASQWEQYGDTFNRIIYNSFTRGLQEQAKELTKQHQAVQEAIAGIDSQLSNSQARRNRRLEEGEQALLNYIGTLNIQAQTFGMTAREARIYELSLNAVDRGAIRRARELDKELTMKEASRKAQKDLQDENDRVLRETEQFESTLRMQIATYGMSADAAKLYGLELAHLEKRISDSRFAELKGLIAQKKALDDRQRMLEEGKRLTEQFADPAEQFAKKVADINRLFGAGAINRKTFDKAIDQAQKELDRESNQLTIRYGMEADNTAIRKGTAEFRKLIAQAENRTNVAVDNRRNVEAAVANVQLVPFGGAGPKAAVEVLKQTLFETQKIAKKKPIKVQQVALK